MTKAFQRSIGLLGCCASVTALTAPAYGQTTVADDAEVRQPDEIIVTAQRRSESLSKVPVAVTAISGDSLANQAIVTEKDLQAAVPGLLVRSTQNSNQLNYALRGQSIDAFSFGNPAVLPYENEVQIPNNAASAFFDLASVQVLKGPQGTLFGRNSTGGAVLFTTEMPTNNFEGFVTARVGNFDAVNLTGALNIPIVDDKVLLRLAGFYENRDGYQRNLFTGNRLGEVDRYALRATLAVKPADGIENTTVISYRESGGSSLTPVAYSGKPPPSTSPIPAATFYGPTLDAAIGFPGAWNIYLAANPQADPGGLFAFITTQRERGPFIVDVDTEPKHDSKAFTVTNTTSIDLSDNAQLKNIFGYSFAKAVDTADIDGTPYGIQYSAQNGFLNRQRQISEELQLSGTTFGNDLTYVLGAYFVRGKTRLVQDSSFFDLRPIIAPASVLYITDTTVRDYAVYGQGTYDLSDFVAEGLSLTAGLRYTDEKVSQAIVPGSTFFNVPIPGATNLLSSTVKRFSYQFGLSEQVNNNLLLYAVTRHSFRSGGFNGGTPPIPGFADTGGAGFRPELATDYEIGAKFNGYTGNLPTAFNLALYSQTVKDQQKTFYANLPGIGLVGLTSNVPKTRIQGVELDVRIEPTSWLTVGAAGTYTDAKFTDNIVTILGTTQEFGPYPDTPEWTGNVYADVSVPISNLGTFVFRGDVYSQSRFFFGSLNNTTVPGTDVAGYTLVNLRVGIDDIAGTGLSVGFSARNLTDEVYFVGGIPTSGVFDVNTAIPGDPQTFMGEVTFRF